MSGATWDETCLPARVSALKDFRFVERRYPELRFDGFNFANHPNFGDPNASLSSNAVNAAGVAITGHGRFWDHQQPARRHQYAGVANEPEAGVLTVSG